jgi:signal transduction histidine kinase
VIGDFLHLTIHPTETVFFFIQEEREMRIVLASRFSVKNVVTEDYLALASRFFDEGSLDAVFVERDSRFLFKKNFLYRQDKNAIWAAAARLGVGAIVPIVVQGKIKMIMMVGYKFSGAPFDVDDRAFLSIVARRVAIVLENRELHEAMECQASRIEERIFAGTEHIKNMYESQSRFLTDVSHEFKTPLAILKMHAHVFSRSKNAKQQRAWYVMDTTLDRLSRLVSNLLDISRKNSLSHALLKEQITLDDLLSEVCDDCALLFEDKGIHLSLRTEHACVFGDRDKLKEVILNLLSNALRHTPSDGSIFLSVGTADSEAEITVRDTGDGIPRENMSHLFERFYRIEENSLTGTGIGLYLCRQIIELHGGTVTVASEVGEGSCFVVRLPLAPRGSP